MSHLDIPADLLARIKYAKAMNAKVSAGELLVQFLTYMIDEKSVIEKPIKIEIGTKKQLGKYLRFIRSINPAVPEGLCRGAAAPGQGSKWSRDKLYHLNA